ncbi:hypothetical protein POSPLADRAFT_1130162 [Postia placenta MAD-698-R-SB12]|uniref:Major facilitator superfamily (MFS) profile domain-containing protein n=1 Tax=Postia placenta MAD-698-R-SB12 TaxID=670580 RepID=A0A1X6NGZ6_9APHY|nr:hypothetical protein POSPLADRAFT_1130162 [Postia placenta MAD-698-R-SB12]OSX67899.1 hypothetical protein POSPLADRAFT_1130162 [Postia placenta MAD-698-R-SB12]
MSSRVIHDAGIGGNARRPWGLQWRSSVWYVTLGTNSFTGVTTDLLVYSLIVPVVPFRLEALGYSGVSGLVGWLLFAYSAGLVAFTPPIAQLSERFNARKIPLLIGQVALIGAQIMLMLAPSYWLMVLARVFQGLSSSVIWVVGLALLCDTVPEKTVARQLGIAMSGLSIGFLVGPPVAGALYNSFGFHGPFIFGITVTAFDLIARLILVERHHALRWDPERHATPAPECGDLSDPPSTAPVTNTTNHDETHEDTTARQSNEPSHLSLLAVLGKLLRSSRALATCFSTLIYGMILTSQEPALPLYLQASWRLNSSKVGLVYIAAVVPTLFSSTIAGWWVDRIGTGLITVVSLLFALPWLGLLIVQKSLAFFIVMFALSNFAVSGTVSALTAELATISRRLDGVGYAHVYGAFNLSYGIGSGLGPVIGGQLYDHLERGWMAICLFGIGLSVIAIFLALVFYGDETLFTQLTRNFKRSREN